MKDNLDTCQTLEEPREVINLIYICTSSDNPRSGVYIPLRGRILDVKEVIHVRPQKLACVLI